MVDACGGVKSLQIRHRSGRENINADALSRSPTGRPVSEGSDDEVIMQVQSEDVSDLLKLAPEDQPIIQSDVLATEQRKEAKLQAIYSSW